MAYGLPARGQSDWDDELNNSVEALRSETQTATANAGQARSNATEAIAIAQDAAARSRAAVAPADDAVASFVGDATSATATALTATYAPLGVDATQRFMAKVDAELEDVRLLVLGDSTGNESNEWIYLLAQEFATRFPTHTISYRLWDDAATDYAVAVTLGTGTGARTITVYNASVSGFSTYAWHGTRAQAAIYNLSPAPDLTIVSLGHNETATTDLWHGQYVGLTESITARVPGTSLMVIAQNPNSTDTLQQQRREVYREIAAQRGYGFIDVCQAFLDDPAGIPALLADTLHPNATGSALWRDTVKAAFVRSKRTAPRPQQPSTLLGSGVNLLRNGSFAARLDYWIASNVTAAVDDTNFETALNTVGAPANHASTAQKVTATATGGYLYQWVPVNRVKGQWVTLAVRLRVPEGQPASVGRIAINDSGGSTGSIGITHGQGAFRWAVVTRFIDPATTSLHVRVYADAGETLGNCTIDRAILVTGKFPADLPANPSAGTQSWANYTPALTGITLGAGTLTASHLTDEDTDIVDGYVRVTLAANSAITGAVTVALPSSLANAYSWISVDVKFLDSGTNQYQGLGLFLALDQITVAALGTSGAKVNLSSTAPFTWATGDQIDVKFRYRKAA